MGNFKSFLKSTSGNFATMAALSAFLITFAAGFAIESSSMYSTRSDLQNMADAATLAAATAANKTDANGQRLDRLAAARASIATHTLNLGDEVTLEEPIIIFDDVTQEVTVTLPAKRSLFFSGLFKQSEANITAQSAASYKVADINPVSLAFVIDVSGSMGWCPSQDSYEASCPAGEQPRINTLKQAVSILFTEIESGNANINELKDKIRTGVWTYRSTESSFVNMSDGWNHTESFVSGLTTTGGTHSTDAFKSALEALDNEARNISDPNLKRFIVFMTDGANNDVNSTLDTEVFCSEAKEQGINIFSVAFAAPIEGENLLLQCASPNDDEEISDPGEFEYDAREERIDDDCDRFTDPTDGESNGRQRCERRKEENYFDADSEEEFKSAFAKIGNELGKIETRLTR